LCQRFRPNGRKNFSLKLKRETDEASVELVRAFLDGVEVELVVPSGRNLVIFITAYSQSDDGTEEFSFSVEREMKESGEIKVASSDTEAANNTNQLLG